MRPVFDTYLSLVRASLWRQAAQWPVAETDIMLRLNAMQGTGALVFPAVLSQEDIPAPVKMQMKGVCMQTMQQHVHLQHTLEQAWTAFEKAGIHAVLMKGAGLAALYPEPQMRTWGDIDLFVGIDQYHPACAVMRDTFPDALKFDEELDHYKHYNLIADGVSIEIHRVSVGHQHPVDERRYAAMEAAGMAKGEPLAVGGLDVRVPEPTFNALFVLLHSWEHMMTQGANMRQLCDWTLLLHRYKDTINRAQLKRDLKALALMDVWQLYGWIAVRKLGLPENEMPFYTPSCGKRAELLLDDLLSGRMVAPKPSDKAPQGRIARKLHTMRERMANAQRMAKFSPAYARHMKMTTLLNGARRFFAKDRHWE